MQRVKVDDLDVTEKLIDYATSVVADLPPISGYIFKRGSPSCGMERVKVYTDKGMPNASSSGLYAGVLMRSLPLLPVEEEGRLNDPVLRESFIERVYVYDRWQRLCERPLTPLGSGGLLPIQSREKTAPCGSPGPDAP